MKALHGILMYQPAFKDYLYGALQEMHNDKIQHVQVSYYYFLETLTIYCRFVFVVGIFEKNNWLMSDSGEQN